MYSGISFSDPGFRNSSKASVYVTKALREYCPAISYICPQEGSVISIQNQSEQPKRNKMKILLIVGTGSFAGGILRYLTGILLQRMTQSVYPYGTLTANIIGCFLIGIFFGIAEKGNILTPEWRIFLTTGLCGGFTTFSTFSLDALHLMNDRGIITALAYIGISIFIGILFTFSGILITIAI